MKLEAGQFEDFPGQKDSELKEIMRKLMRDHENPHVGYFHRLSVVHIEEPANINEEIGDVASSLQAFFETDKTRDLDAKGANCSHFFRDVISYCQIGTHLGLTAAAYDKFAPRNGDALNRSIDSLDVYEHYIFDT